MEFYADLFSRLKAAQGQEPDNTAQNSIKAITLGEALEAEVPSAYTRQKIYEDVILNTLIREKLIRTPDAANYRFASVYGQVGEKRNRQTPFLALLEAKGVEQVNDFQVDIREWNIGQDAAEVWNIENDLPSDAASARPKRTNTLTCVGNKLSTSLIVENIMQQQAQIDIMAREVDMEITRIRRKMNALLLASVENKTEGQFGLPTLGGFVTRSTDYNLGVGGGDLTRSLIQGRVDAIANNANAEGLGYDLPLLGITNARQLGVLRDIIISEYSGINPVSRIEYENILRAKLGAAADQVQMVFECMPGGVVGFLSDSQLTSGTTVLFDYDQPRLAKMKLNGQFGPFVMTRPTEKLQTLNVCFDLFTLIDPIVASRAVLTGHA